jgi:hypothetical protein
MPRLCRLVVLAFALAVLGAVASPRALADTPPPPCSPLPFMPQSIESAHFFVAYNDDPKVQGFMTQTEAGTVLAAAERSYASYVADGFPAPVTDPSTGKTDLVIMDLSTWKLSSVVCFGAVIEDTSTVTGDLMPYSVGSDVFTQVEYSIGDGPQWLQFGASSWASWRALGYPATSIADIGPFDMTLDCDSAFDKDNCSRSNGYENVGESRWPFYEYLTEKFGPLFIVKIFAASQAAGDGLQGLENALIAKGTTLSAEYGAYAAKLLTGGWTATTLSAAVIPVSGTPIQTGISSGAIPTQTFGINHLATKFVEIDRGDTSGDHTCYVAKLTLNVQIPAGVTSQPTFYWAGGGSAPVPLTVSGSTATTTVPWDTCLWKTKGYLALPNTSLVDGTTFVVSGTLNVDFSIPATSALPPSASAQFGPVIDASSFSTAPTLTLFGPQLLKLTAQDTQVRLIVESSSEGSVTASIGSLVLGTAALRPGGNDLRFSLPATLLRSLRRSSGTMVLTLTPLALDGTTAGTAVTTTLSLPVAKPPAKKQPAKKQPAKKQPAKKQPKRTK